MENDTTKITKLNDAKQWTVWKFQVKVVFESLDVWDLVTDIEKEPTKGSSEEQDAFDKRLKAFNKKDATARKVVFIFYIKNSFHIQ